MIHRRVTRTVSRRWLLARAGGTSLAASLLAACTPSPVAPKPAEQTASQAAAAAAKPPDPARPTEPAKPATAPKAGGTVRLHLWTEDPPALDPYLNVSFRTQELAAFFYSRLLMSKKAPGVAAQAYVMEGDLAETWKVSDDGLTYTFNLRTDAGWHNKPPLNGRPVTAQDVTWSFERFMKVSPQKSTLEQVADVTAPNDKTVVFKLKAPFAPFEASIGGPIFWIMPREVVEQDGDAQKRVIGSGPFVFDKLDRGVSLSGKRNPAYYRKGEPRVDEFVALIIPDTATQMAGLRGKELDYLMVPQQELDALKKSNPEIQYVEWEYNYIPFIYWKLDKPPFNDPRVRQAVSMSLDRDEMIKVVYNGRGNWNNAIPWALSEWWLDPRGAEMGPNARFFKFDPAESRKLLAAAGFPDGLKVEMISTPGYSQIFVQQVELIQQQLKKGGIDAQIKMQEYAAYIATTFRGQFEGGNVLVAGLETPFTEPHDFLFNMYHPKGTRNHAGVNDPRLSEMIERQAATLDRADRKKQIFEIQRYLAEQMYYPPNAASMRTAGLSPAVRDCFPRSDYGLGAEVVPKLWLDR
ncbi:MAG: ABC transporter substrate-binding protein [Chloroflexota bacterium]